jgi:hypothetical protein
MWNASHFLDLYLGDLKETAFSLISKFFKCKVSVCQGIGELIAKETECYKVYETEVRKDVNCRKLLGS